MTTEEKKAEIIPMLGAKVEVWEEVGKDYYKGTIYNPIMGDNWCCGMGDKDKCMETLVRHAKYDTDANWQLYAIDWIENQGYPVHIVKKTVVIYSNNTISSPSIWNGTKQRFSTKKEAIFEAIYQFSQYLKTKNNAKEI